MPEMIVTFSNDLTQNKSGANFRLTIIRIFSVLSVIILGYPINSQAQDSDKLNQFQILAIIEKCQDRLGILERDLNLLKDDLTPSEAKEEITGFIYSSFTKGEMTRVASDLKSNDSFHNAKQLDLSTFLLDFQISPITHVNFALDSVRFTLPQSRGENIYELYLGYSQLYSGNDANGNPLDTQKKLATFRVEKDSTDNRFIAKIVSIVFLQENKVQFINIPIKVVMAEYKAARDSMVTVGVSEDKFEYTSELSNAIYQEYSADHEESTTLLNDYLSDFQHFRSQGQVLKAAEKFAQAINIRRLDSRILGFEKPFKTELNDEIKKLADKSYETLLRWEYDKADSLINHNEKLIEYFSTIYLHPSKHENIVQGQRNEVDALINTFNQYKKLVNVKASREELKTILKKSKYAHPCNISQENDSSAFENYVLALIELTEKSDGWKERADKYYRDALNCKQDFTLAREKLIEIANSQEEREENYRNLIAFDKTNAENQYKLGQLLSWNEKRHDEAIEILNTAVNHDPNHAKSYALLGELYSKNKQFSEAVEACEKANDLKATDRNSIFLTFSCLELEGSSSQRALQYVKDFAEDTRVSEMVVHDSIAKHYISEAEYIVELIKGQYEKAVEIYEKLFVFAGHVKHYGEYWTDAANCYHQLEPKPEYFERAIELSEISAENTNHNFPDAYMVWGKSLSAAGRYEEAEKKFKILTELSPSDYDAYFARGKNLLKEGRDYVTARHYFNSAAGLAEQGRADKKMGKGPQYYALLEIGKCYRLENNIEKSIETISNAVQMLRDIQVGYYELGLSLIQSSKKSDIKKAIKNFKKADDRGYSTYDCKSSQAQGYMKIGKHVQAKELLNQISEKFLDKMDWRDRQTRASINLFYYHDYKGVRNDLNAIAKDFPERTTTYEYHVLYGMLLTKETVDEKGELNTTESLNPLTEAAELFEQARVLDASKPLAYLGLSICKFYQDNVDEAKNHLKTSLLNNLEIKKYKKDRVLRSYFTSKEIKQTIRSN